MGTENVNEIVGSANIAENCKQILCFQSVLMENAYDCRSVYNFVSYKWYEGTGKYDKGN